jgi:hypothetical protein
VKAAYGMRAAAVLGKERAVAKDYGVQVKNDSSMKDSPKGHEQTEGRAHSKRSGFLAKERKEDLEARA